MGEFVTDTDSLVLHLRSSPELGAEAARIFQRTKGGADTVLIPSVVYAEVMELPAEFAKLSTNLKRGRYRIVAFDEKMADLLIDMSLESIPKLTQRIAVATAKQEDLKLITNVSEIINCGEVGTIWDSVEVMLDVSVFLSYARQDEVAVRQIYDRLREETRSPGVRLKPWIDQEDVFGGTKWKVVIEQAIRSSDFFLLCLSNKSVGKRGVLQQEIRYALDVKEQLLEEDLFLIPVKLEECQVPESLRDIQWVDLFKPDGWGKLMRSIDRDVRERVMVKKRSEEPDYE